MWNYSWGGIKGATAGNCSFRQTFSWATLDEQLNDSLMNKICLQFIETGGPTSLCWRILFMYSALHFSTVVLVVTDSVRVQQGDTSFIEHCSQRCETRLGPTVRTWTLLLACSALLIGRTTQILWPLSIPGFRRVTSGCTGPFPLHSGCTTTMRLSGIFGVLEYCL